MASRPFWRASVMLLLGVQSVLLLGQQSPSQNAFTIRDASLLMDKIARGVQTNQREKLLSAFDLARMSEGRTFRQQIISFLSHYDYIRIHFNLTQVLMDGEKGLATVEAEMEADAPNAYTPPMRKRATLHFTAEHTASGWRFVEMQPRDFFSTPNAPARSAPPQ